MVFSAILLGIPGLLLSAMAEETPALCNHSYDDICGFLSSRTQTFIPRLRASSITMSRFRHLRHFFSEKKSS